jgi:WD40 repeat protein
VVVDLTSRQVRSLPPAGAEYQNFIQFAPDGQRLALAVNRAGKFAVDVRDAATGKVQQSLPQPKGSNYPAWHPDGRTLAICSDDHLIRLWDVASGRLLRVLEGYRSVGIHCAFTHTGDRLVSNSWDGVLRIWEPSSGRQLLSFPASGFYVQRVGADDRVVVHHIADQTRLQLLRLHGGLEYRTIGPAVSRRRTIQYGDPKVHPGGRLLAAAGTDGAVVVIDLAAGREVATLPAPVDWERPLLWEPSGNLLTCGSSGCRRWPLRADPAEPGRYRLGPGEQLLSFRSLDEWGSSADGQTIAVPDYDRGAVVVHRGQPARTVPLQPQQDVRHCAVSPDGRWVATGSHTNTDGWGAKVWDAATGELAREFRVPALCGVTFSPDGRWLMTTSGGCRLWEVGSWKAGPKVGGRDGCFSPDGRLLAVEDSAGAIRMVRPGSGRVLARLEAPEQTQVLPCCFTPDGTQLIAVGRETRALHVWDLRRLRKGLTRLRLDWDAPPYPDAGPADLSPREVIINLGPAELIRSHTERGNAHAENALWDQAAAEYAALVRLQPDDHWLWIRYGYLCLQRGDVAGHRRCCVALLERFAGTADASIAHRVALACLVRPGVVSDLKLLRQLAERGVAGAPRDAWHLLTLGAAHYRAGRQAEAINRLREALEAARADPDRFRYASVLSRLFLAMTYHAAGQAERARQWLDQAVYVIDFDFPQAGRVPLGDHWQEWITCQVIRREAEALIGGPSKQPKK